MPRRGRRSGVRFIEDDRDRSLTFFKRRSGLYKAAADLSTLTGAKVALVLESESGKFSAFGTPTPGPIIEAFLSGKAPMPPYGSEEQKATITELQNELFQLEKDMVVEDKRKKDSVALMKELQESSSVARFAYGKVEDLEPDEIRDMYHKLSRLHREIQQLLHAVQRHGQQQQHEVGTLRDPSLLQPAWWRSLPSQLPPRRVLPPWIPVQPSGQLLLPPQQLPPRSSFSSSMVTPPLQSPVVPSSPHRPAPQYNESSYYHPPLPQQFFLPLSIDQSQLPFNGQNHHSSTEVSQNIASRSGSATPTDRPYYANHVGGLNLNASRSGSTTLTERPYYANHVGGLNLNASRSGSTTPTERPYYANHVGGLNLNASRSGTTTPTDRPYYASLGGGLNKASRSGSTTPTDIPYGTSLGGLNVALGGNSGNGVQADGGGHPMVSFSGLVHGDGGWIDELLSSESSPVANSGAAGAGNNLCGINVPWN